MDEKIKKRAKEIQKELEGTQRFYGMVALKQLRDDD